MHNRILLVSLISLPLVACQPHPAPNVAEDVGPPPATMPCCQYVVSGGVAHPGPRTLRSSDTVSTVLAREMPQPPERAITVILIRQAPEGKTRELVQINAEGKLMDEKQDWTLRNGDELVFPGGEGSNSTRNPTGPPPRSGE